MTTFFTSDWHFSHINIPSYCPQRYEYLGIPEPGASGAEMTMEEMNDGLVDLWNRQVNPGDVVFVIGDMCMGKVAETIENVGRLNGRKALVLGNHDRPHPCITRDPLKRAEWFNCYRQYFDQIVTEMTYSFDGVEALVQHFPYDGIDHSEEVRYQEFRPHDGGLPLVHGHVHDLYQTNGRMFNVGIDAWNGRMITPEEIGQYFRSAGFA